VPVVNRRAGELLHIPEGVACNAPYIARLAGTGADASGACDQVQPDGTILEIHTHELATGGVVRTYTDITERKGAEAQIIHLALHDSLTGLPNRRMLADRLGEAVRRPDDGGAVLLVDLDRFKNVNDRHGHSFGDRLLVQAASRMRNLVGGDDLVARIGGDEFCILQAAGSDPAAAEALARAIVGLLSEPYLIDGQEVMLSASVGIARHPHDGSSVDDILTRADTALYRAKERGRTTFRFYEAAMDVRIAEQRLLEQDLRDALARGQLSLVYQPIFDTLSRRITGFEALLRWFHPTRGAISPEEFIPIAEACGVIVQLGEWGLETACTEARRWPQPLSVAVNLSPRQFRRPDLPDRVAAILAMTGLPASRLTLEVTEGVLIDNPQATLHAMGALQRQGVRVVLDDFGTGYSSLSYLRRFPFDGIKVDRSFVRTLSEDEGSRAIMRAILTLGHSLRLRVVAEGVETETQLDWLRTEHCGQVQGYLLGRPMPSRDIGAFLADSDDQPADARASEDAAS
jgi:diguanylate cyclase (GGDEF)-like protein